MKVCNTVLWTVQTLGTTWDNSNHPGCTQSKRLLRQPRDEIMLHIFIAGEMMSCRAGNRGTSLGNKSRFCRDDANRKFQPSSASNVACAVGQLPQRRTAPSLERPKGFLLMADYVRGGGGAKQNKTKKKPPTSIGGHHREIPTLCPSRTHFSNHTTLKTRTFYGTDQQNLKFLRFGILEYEGLQTFIIHTRIKKTIPRRIYFTSFYRLAERQVMSLTYSSLPVQHFY